MVASSVGEMEWVWGEMGGGRVYACMVAYFTPEKCLIQIIYLISIYFSRYFILIRRLVKYLEIRQMTYIKPLLLLLIKISKMICL